MAERLVNGRHSAVVS